MFLPCWPALTGSFHLFHQTPCVGRMEEGLYYYNAELPVAHTYATSVERKTLHNHLRIKGHLSIKGHLIVHPHCALPLNSGHLLSKGHFDVPYVSHLKVLYSSLAYSHAMLPLKMYWKLARCLVHYEKAHKLDDVTTQ